jgi:hypothetical protein
MPHHHTGTNYFMTAISISDMSFAPGNDQYIYFSVLKSQTYQWFVFQFIPVQPSPFALRQEKKYQWAGLDDDIKNGLKNLKPSYQICNGTSEF